MFNKHDLQLKVEKSRYEQEFKYKYIQNNDCLPIFFFISAVIICFQFLASHLHRRGRKKILNNYIVCWICVKRQKGKKVSELLRPHYFLFFNFFTVGVCFLCLTELCKVAANVFTFVQCESQCSNDQSKDKEVFFKAGPGGGRFLGELGRSPTPKKPMVCCFWINGECMTNLVDSEVQVFLKKKKKRDKINTQVKQIRYLSQIIRLIHWFKLITLMAENIWEANHECCVVDVFYLCVTLKLRRPVEVPTSHSIQQQIRKFTSRLVHVERSSL